MLDDFLSYQAKTTPHPLGLAIKEQKEVILLIKMGKNILTLSLVYRPVV